MATRELRIETTVRRGDGEGLRALVDNHDLRERFVNMAVVFGEEPLARYVARAVGFDRNRDGTPIAPENATNGVLVLLGLAEDRFGGRRTRVRRYREMQFTAAFEGLSLGYREGAADSRSGIAVAESVAWEGSA